MPGLLDALRGRMKQRELSAFDTVAAAARAAANGDTYDVVAIENALVESRLTTDDFESAVELAGRRAAWLRDFDKLAAAATKLRKAEAAIAAEQAKFEDTRRAFHERITAMDADRAAAAKATEAGEIARAALLDPQNVPGTVGQKYREALAVREEANGEVGRLQRDLREVVQRIKDEEGWVAQLTGTNEPAPRLLSSGAMPSTGTPESGRLDQHRRFLARANRRKVEIETELRTAEQAAAQAAAAVEDLIPQVLKT